MNNFIPSYEQQMKRFIIRNIHLFCGTLNSMNISYLYHVIISEIQTGKIVVKHYFLSMKMHFIHRKYLLAQLNKIVYRIKSLVWNITVNSSAINRVRSTISEQTVQKLILILVVIMHYHAHIKIKFPSQHYLHGQQKDHPMQDH